MCFSEHKNIGERKTFEPEQKMEMKPFAGCWKNGCESLQLAPSLRSHTRWLFFLKRIEFFVCGVYDIYYSLNITKFNHSRLWCWTLGRKNKRNWKIKGSGSLFTGLTDEESIFITLKSSDIVQWTYNWCQVTPSVLLALWTPQPFGGASFCVLLRKTLTILFSQLIISLIWLWCLCGQVYYQIWWPF